VAGVVAAALSVAAAEGAFQPGEVAFDALRAGERGDVDAVLRDELQTTGMVQVSGVPGLAELRKQVLEQSVVCAGASAAAKSAVFDDHTVRRTLATDGAIGMQHEGAAKELCSDFDAKSKALGQLVDATTELLIQRVSALFKLQLPVSRASGGSYDSVADVVTAGSHLDHFHSYKANAGEVPTTDISTADFHVDQGLFIAFVPALMFDAKNGEQVHQESGKFLVELRDGSKEETVFSEDGDVLVFMMGDGVNQVINSKLSISTQLRATPHAFVVPASAEDVWRSWFGRMFFLPGDAVHEESGLSFGEIRKILNLQSEALPESLSVGCSGSKSIRILQEEIDCKENQLYCWHSCTDFTETVSNDECVRIGKEVKCVDSNDHIWVPTDNHNGDVSLKCSNSTTFITDPETDEGEGDGEDDDDHDHDDDDHDHDDDDHDHDHDHDDDSGASYSMVSAVTLVSSVVLASMASL